MWELRGEKICHRKRDMTSRNFGQICMESIEFSYILCKNTLPDAPNRLKIWQLCSLEVLYSLGFSVLRTGLCGAGGLAYDVRRGNDSQKVVLKSVYSCSWVPKTYRKHIFSVFKILDWLQYFYLHTVCGRKSKKVKHLFSNYYATITIQNFTEVKRTIKIDCNKW